MAKKTKTYSKELRLKAVRMYIEEGLGSTAIAKKLGVTTYKQVLLWVRRYNELGLDGLEERRGKSKGILKGRPQKSNLSLEEENFKLRAEVEYLKKLIQIGRV